MNNRFPWPELVAAGCVGLNGFVELHIWSPAYSYFMVMLLVLLDVVTDLVLNQRVFRRRILLILPAYTLVMAFAFTFGKHELALRWLPQAVIVLIVVIHLRRLVKNFAKLHLVDGDVATVLDARLGRRLEGQLDEVETKVLPETVPQDEAVPA